MKEVLKMQEHSFNIFVNRIKWRHHLIYIHYCGSVPKCFYIITVIFDLAGKVRVMVRPRLHCSPTLLTQTYSKRE